MQVLLINLFFEEKVCGRAGRVHQSGTERDLTVVKRA
jgi:hypothetical protein